MNCKHCGMKLEIKGHTKGGRVLGTKHSRYRGVLIQHLKDNHPAIAGQYAGFTNAKGFHFADHTA